MRCYACSRATPPRQRYCSRYRPFVMDRKEQLKRRAAMREAYDPDQLSYYDGKSPPEPCLAPSHRWQVP